MVLKNVELGFKVHFTVLTPGPCLVGEVQF
jgi:hypothetical protein